MCLDTVSASCLVLVLCARVPRVSTHKAIEQCAQRLKCLSMAVSIIVVASRPVGWGRCINSNSAVAEVQIQSGNVSFQLIDVTPVTGLGFECCCICCCVCERECECVCVCVCAFPIAFRSATHHPYFVDRVKLKVKPG